MKLMKIEVLRIVNYNTIVEPNSKLAIVVVAAAFVVAENRLNFEESENIPNSLWSSQMNFEMPAVVIQRELRRPEKIEVATVTVVVAVAAAE